MNSGLLLFISKVRDYSRIMVCWTIPTYMIGSSLVTGNWQVRSIPSIISSEVGISDSKRQSIVLCSFLSLSSAISLEEETSPCLRSRKYESSCFWMPQKNESLQQPTVSVTIISQQPRSNFKAKGVLAWPGTIKKGGNKITKKDICTMLVSQHRKTLTIEELSFLRCSSTWNRTLVSRDL